MKKLTRLFTDGNHTWDVIARDPEKPSYIIDTNEYLISLGSESILLDPGGLEIFPEVFSAISTDKDPGQIKQIFASHQDPDIISSLALWLEFKPSLQCYSSWLWVTFIPHFGGNNNTFIEIPDEGMEISLGSLKLQAIPAHYLHSSGNFHLYDEKARILFTGDVGAALLPPEMNSMFVADFEKHIKYAEGFHKRWMGSNRAKNDWINRVRLLQIDMLCPQHGAIYRGENVLKFLDWFERLEVGTGVK